MRGPLLALVLLAYPLAEIAGFILVGRHLGVLPTIGLIIGTGVVGSILLRFQGIGVIRRIRKEMQAGGDPSRDVAHGAMIMIAGVLLLLPGFLTDIIGLLLFLPPVRDIGWRFVRSRINITSGFSGFARGRRAQGNTIDLDEDDYTVSHPPKPSRGRIGKDQ